MPPAGWTEASETDLTGAIIANASSSPKRLELMVNLTRHAYGEELKPQSLHAQTPDFVSLRGSTSFVQ
jgi:hypothetical protein